ncbi:Gfo/Idh/MocA family oxidoreductase [Occultella glacieicola]|uniref:Gfo/Idh/MocA family oxidoreductase n=2 Tax=Occultella glacieicola TaxID=2518684 RepID=A0ABY2DXK1_9MICO|nr:Gfo/Idh/MocA family oxidoreductase [Occultella glacieicola]
MIGAGGIAGAHLSAWLSIGAEISHFSTAGAQALAASHGGVAVDSFAELLDLVDVVDIVTPTPSHLGYVQAGAAAGKHVFCEKPLARTSTDARLAIEACRAAGVQLYPGHVVRYFSEYESMHREVAAGTIGTVAVQRFTRTGSRPDMDWFHDEEASGGVILDQMIHDLDFACWNAGPVGTVFARQAGTGTGKDGVVSAHVILQHHSGAITHAAGTWARPGTAFRTTFEIAGTGGILRHDSAEHKPLVIDGGAGHDGRAGTGLLPEVSGVGPFELELSEIARAFMGGDPPRVSAEDGLAAILVAEAAVTSLQIGQPVAVAPIGNVEVAA